MIHLPIVLRTGPDRQLCSSSSPLLTAHPTPLLLSPDHHLSPAWLTATSPLVSLLHLVHNPPRPDGSQKDVSKIQP